MNKEVEDNIDNEAVDREAEDINTEDVDTEKAAEDIKEADINEETENVSGEKDDKKGFFKKKDKKDKKDLQIEELTDKYRRTMAEFDNFRKRTEKEKSAMYEIGARDIVIKILPVVDNFERGLAAIPEDDRTTPVAEGMDKIYKQLTKTLEELGVKEIEAEGAEFNPDYHNAVMHVDDDSLGENVVAEVLQKGYFYKDSVVRHSMVKVAN